MTIRVKKLSGSYSSVKVRPTLSGIVPVAVDANTIELTIPSWQARKFSIEYDGDRFHNLMVLPEKPDPDRPDPENLPSNVIYYGPGVWNPQWITLRDNQTLYIDEGAVVYAKSIRSVTTRPSRAGECSQEHVSPTLETDMPAATS